MKQSQKGTLSSYTTTYIKDTHSQSDLWYVSERFSFTVALLSVSHGFLFDTCRIFLMAVAILK